MVRNTPSSLPLVNRWNELSLAFQKTASLLLFELDRQTNKIQEVSKFGF
jgi:hypothetical protein